MRHAVSRVTGVLPRSLRVLLSSVYHGLETRVQLSEERRFAGQGEDPLLHHGALHVVVLDHHVLLKDLDGVQLIGALPLSQHHLEAVNKISLAGGI